MRDERIDVTEVVHAYATGVDTRDWALCRSIFTDEVELREQARDDAGAAARNEEGRAT